jgi:hypothetical protein
MEQRPYGALLALCLVLTLMALGIAQILYFRRVRAEHRPRTVSGRWIGEGLLRLDDYTPSGRVALVKACLCLILFLAIVPLLPPLLDQLVPQPPSVTGRRSIPSSSMTLGMSAGVVVSALLAWLVLTLVAAAQFLLAQRYALVSWSEAGWRRLWASSVFDAEGRALRANAKWLFLAAILAFGLAQTYLAVLRALPLGPK